MNSRPALLNDQIQEQPRLFLEKRFWFLVALAGLLRGLIIVSSIGTNDIFTWERFANSVNEHGIFAVYRFSDTNHPPLANLLAWIALWAAKTAAVPFSWTFKSISVLADVFSFVALCSIFGESSDDSKKNLLAFSFLPILILISAYHGNTEPIVIAALLGSLALLRHERRFFTAGVLLALSWNIKLTAILFVPVLFAFALKRNRAIPFGLGLASGLIPFILAFVFSGPPLITNVLKYNSVFEFWGFTALFYASKSLAPDAALAAMSMFASTARYVIVFFSLLSAVLVLKSAPDKHFNTLCRALVLTCSAFLFFAPGLGVQYLVLPASLLCLYDTRNALVSGIATGAFTALVYSYFAVSTFPFLSLHTSQWPIGIASLGILVWIQIGVVGFQTLRELVFGAKG